jgi:hypothetical protein
MKRYWDYSERERAALTTEQVQGLLARELMEKGVLQVDPPKLEEVVPVDIRKGRVFSLAEVKEYGNVSTLGLSFSTLEQAEAVKLAAPLVRVTSYGEEPHVRLAHSLQIVTEEMPSEESVTLAKAALAENRRREQANASAKAEYERAQREVDKATADVWSDWAKCQRTEERHKKIRATLDEYTRMTEGNTEMARGFLAKVFDADEIEAALAL